MPFDEATKRKLLVGCGWVMVALGAIGLLLPVIPTTPFLVVAAYCFSKGAPRLHRWVRRHKHFGPPLRDWEDHKVIRRKAKVGATIAIIIGFGSSATMLWGQYYISQILIVVATLALLFIWTRNSEPKEVK